MQTKTIAAENNASIKKLLAAIDAGKPHRASSATYQRAVERGLIEYVPTKTPGWGFAGPCQEAHWRRKS